MGRKEANSSLTNQGRSIPSLTMFLVFILTFCLVQGDEVKMHLIDTTDTDNRTGTGINIYHTIQTDTDTGNNIQNNTDIDIDTGQDYSLNYDEYEYEAHHFGPSFAQASQSKRGWGGPSFGCKGRKNLWQCTGSSNGEYCKRYRNSRNWNHGQCCNSCCKRKGWCSSDNSCSGKADRTPCNKRNSRRPRHCMRGKCQIKRNMNFRSMNMLHPGSWG